MAINDIGTTTVVLLSLILPIIAYADYPHRPTAKTKVRQHVSDTVDRNRYTDSINETIVYARLGPRSSEISEGQREQGVSGYNDGKIIYPDSEPKTTCPFGLCTNVAGYPKDLIKKLISRSQFTNGYFEATEEYIHVDNRFSSDEMSMCETMVHTIYPEKANNTQKIEKVIVNVEGHKQGIVFETCVNNGPCKFSSTFPTGYTSYCKQKYIHKRLMVLGDNDKFVFDSFEVPSCCVCTVKKTD